MMLRNILIVLAGLLITLLPAACGKKEASAAKDTSAALVVSVDPEDAVVLVQGKKYAANQEMKLPAGEYVILIEKSGYQTIWKTISLKAGKKTGIPVTMEQNRSTALFVTNEDGVKITLEQDGQVIKSGSSPLYVTDLLPGEYSYIAEKQGFTTQTVPLKIDDRGMTEKVQIRMENTIGFLDLKLKPADSVVYVNGKETAYSGTPLNLPAGNYEIRVVKKGFEEQNSMVEVQKKKISVLHFDLRQKKAKLSVKVEGHPDAVVKINGEVVNSPEKWQEVDAGTYKIEVTKNYYDKKEVEISLDPEQEEQVVISGLNRNTGSIRLKLPHPGIKITLNGKVIGVTQPDSNGGAKEFLVEGLAVGGKYKFTFEHPYQLSAPRPRTVAIREDNKHVTENVRFIIANATLRHKAGKGRISGKVHIEDLNNEEYGVTGKSESGGTIYDVYRKDRVHKEDLPEIGPDPKYNYSSYDLLKAAGK